MSSVDLGRWKLVIMASTRRKLNPGKYVEIRVPAERRNPGESTQIRVPRCRFQSADRGGADCDDRGRPNSRARLMAAAVSDGQRHTIRCGSCAVRHLPLSQGRTCPVPRASVTNACCTPCCPRLVQELRREMQARRGRGSRPGCMCVHSLVPLGILEPCCGCTAAAAFAPTLPRYSSTGDVKLTRRSEPPRSEMTWASRPVSISTTLPSAIPEPPIRACQVRNHSASGSTGVRRRRQSVFCPWMRAGMTRESGSGPAGLPVHRNSPRSRKTRCSMRPSLRCRTRRREASRGSAGACAIMCFGRL